MTQTEQIVWHKYPDEKPPIRDLYLAHLFIDDEKNSIVLFSIYQDGEFRSEGSLINSDCVIAWANYPKGWQDDTD